MNPRDSDSSSQTQQTDWSRRGAQLLAVVAVLVLIFVGWNLGQSGPAPQRQADPGINATGSPVPGGETPDPYYYDEEHNRYWHETAPGHGHWHQGPPPPEHQRD